MDIYYTKYTSRATGNAMVENNKAMAATLSLADLKSFYKTYKDRFPDLELSLPPHKNSLKSKVRPLLRIPFHRLTSFDPKYNLIELPGDYIPILSWLLKKAWFQLYDTNPDDPVSLKKIQTEIRAKTVKLLVDGEWIDNDESDESLQNLHNVIKNIDLGRRSGLNYASWQNEREIQQTNRYRKKEFRARSAELQEEQRRQSEKPVHRMEEPQMSDFKRHYQAIKESRD